MLSVSGCWLVLVLVIVGACALAVPECLLEHYLFLCTMRMMRSEMSKDSYLPFCCPLSSRCVLLLLAAGCGLARSRGMGMGMGMAPWRN